MNLFTVMLIGHIIAGSICLLTGAIAFSVRKQRGRHTLFGEVYHGSYVVIFLTSVGMAILHWEESSILFYIAVFSYGFALSGYLARKRRRRNWAGKHIGGMLGSYIGLVTAVLVVNGSDIPLLKEVPVLLLWLLPTMIGSPLIFIARQRFKKPKKKKEGFR